MTGNTSRTIHSGRACEEMKPCTSFSRLASWDATITEDRPGELIAWQSVPGSAIAMRGRVTFARAPGRDMTEVRVEMQVGLLRFLENGISIYVNQTPYNTVGVDTEEDVRRVEEILRTGAHHPGA